jgi:nucleoside phosphorylase
MVDMLKRTNHAGDRGERRQKGGVQPQNGADSQKKRFTHEDYTVGWVCPLEVELIAALEMLDEEHEPLPQPPTDHNLYHLGSVAGHKVVIAGLWQAGNNPATAVVTQMRIRFPNLRFALLVGIGGGVPRITERGMLRLGHVVVSQPVGPFSGAIQYDYGKARDGVFERTGALAPPPAVLLLAARSLAAQRARSDKDHIMENVQRIDTSKPQLRWFKFPGVANDMLYPADYKHLCPGLSCEKSKCGTAQCIKREIGEIDQLIVVHRGTVASGELVLRDSALRDQLAKEYGVLCFEMEAAGAMADFPCLVIRGISDYCDSHKNDKWHGFAAAAAAAYARQLFFHMPIDEVKHSVWGP